MLQKNAVSSGVTFSDIAKFFLPITLGAFVVSFIYPIFSWGISRFPDAQTSLAAFSVARSLYFIMASPILVLRQTVVAMITDVQSYRFIKKFTLGVICVNFLLFMVVGLTPVGQFVFCNLLGLEGRLLSDSRQAFILFSFLLIFSGWNMFLQGMAILGGRTSYILYSMLVQISVVVLSMVVSLKIPALNGSSAATLSFVLGVAAAILFLDLCIHKQVVARLPDNPQDTHPLRGHPLPDPAMKKTLLFYLPLVLAMIVLCIEIPLINAALSKTSSSVLNISAFDIAWSLGWLALGCIELSHQVPLYFLRNDSHGYKRMFQFLLVFGLACSLLIGVIGFSGIGKFVLVDLMGIQNNIYVIVIDVMQTLTFLPVLYGIREYFCGILMYRNDTRPVTWGKVINVACLFLLLNAGIHIFVEKPVVFVIYAMIVSELVELAYLWLRSRSRFHGERKPL